MQVSCNTGHRLHDVVLYIRYSRNAQAWQSVARFIQLLVIGLDFSTRGRHRGASFREPSTTRCTGTTCFMSSGSERAWHLLALSLARPSRRPAGRQGKPRRKGGGGLRWTLREHPGRGIPHPPDRTRRARRCAGGCVAPTIGGLFSIISGDSPPVID